MNRRFSIHTLVLGAYTVLALALSWPLLAHITTRVPGVPQWAFDESTFLWNIWYFKHSLIDQAQSPLHSELIYYPLGIDLILYTYNFFHALFAQPLAAAINLPFASNVTLLASTVLSGYGSYLLVRYLTWRMGHREPSGPEGRPGRAQQWAAFTAGLLYAFASNRAIYIYASLGHYDMVTTQWIPFYALALLRGLDGGLPLRRRLGAAALAGLFFAFNGLAEMITALFLAIFTLVVLAALALDRRDPRAPSPLSVLSSLALTGVVAFALWSPVLVPILAQFLTNDFSLRGWGEAIPLSADLLGWFTPTALHPVFHRVFGGDLVDELRRVQLKALDESVPGFRDLNTVFLGWASALLALVGAGIYRSRLRLWAWTALLFGIFTLGPFLQINGRYRFDLDGVEATLSLPFALLHFIPIIKANRAPNRNSVLLMLGLAVLAGFALHWLLRRLPERGRALQTPVALLVCGLLLFEHLAVPLPLSDARVPDVYTQIAADPRPVSVMQLPLGWRNSFGVFGPEQTQLQYFQTVHGKPMLGGNISRAPDFKMNYFERIPFFQALTDIEFGRAVPPETLAAAEAQAAELMVLYDTAYVILLPPIPRRYPYADHWQEAWQFVKRVVPLEPEPFWAQEGIEAYRVALPEGDDAFRLELGEAGTFPYRGEGWDDAETDQPYGLPATWATAQESRLFVPLRQVDPTATYEIRANVYPFAYPDSPAQSVALSVNDMDAGEQRLGAEWQEVSWQLPGAALIDGLNRVVLHQGVRRRRLHRAFRRSGRADRRVGRAAGNQCHGVGSGEWERAA